MCAQSGRPGRPRTPPLLPTSDVHSPPILDPACTAQLDSRLDTAQLQSTASVANSELLKKTIKVIRAYVPTTVPTTAMPERSPAKPESGMETFESNQPRPDDAEVPSPSAHQPTDLKEAPSVYDSIRHIFSDEFSLSCAVKDSDTPQIAEDSATSIVDKPEACICNICVRTQKEHNQPFSLLDTGPTFRSKGVSNSWLVSGVVDAPCLCHLAHYENLADYDLAKPEDFEDISEQFESVHEVLAALSVLKRTPGSKARYVCAGLLSLYVDKVDSSAARVVMRQTGIGIGMNGKIILNEPIQAGRCIKRLDSSHSIFALANLASVMCFGLRTLNS